MRPRALIESCRASHRRLSATVARLTDDDVRRPSLLPGYTRGHVVVHVANKARAHVVVLGGPAAGEIRRLHPEGYEPDVAATVGAGRSAAELCADLDDALALLDAAWDSMEDSQWTDLGIMSAGPRTMAEVVAHHWRNVEVHHVDLDAGYRPADWPSPFVQTELAKRLHSLADRANHADLLAWLLGRGPAPTLGPW